MKTFTFTSRFILLFGLFLVFAVLGYGITLNTDSFNTDKDGWGGSRESWDSSGKRLAINHDDTATKTYTFSGYANQTVSVSLLTAKTDTWEIDDVINITANDKTVYNSNTDGTISFDAPLDGSGKLELIITPKTNKKDEDMYIDNVIITGTPAAQTAPTFSETISNQTANTGSAFSLSASTYFAQTNNDTITYTKSGTLPAGITLNATSGVLSGTSTTVGTYSNIIIIATDNDGATSSNAFSITVSAEPVVTTNLRSFAIRNPVNTRNLRGNMVTIGNTVLCVKNSGVCYNYTGKDANNNLDLQYIDTDSNTSTYNSSQAQLSIPSTATVKWAGLYTQGYLNNNLATSTTRAKVATNLTIPSLGTLSLAPEVIDLYANGSYGYTYNTYAAIPALEGANASSVNGWITGANIKADTGTENSGLGNFGAWTLVVVYENQSDTLKNISVYDGYRRVANSTGFSRVDIAISGFLTPTSGTINSALSVFAGEGDKNIGGDKLYVDGTAINDINAFDSSISGVTTNPSYTNNQGIDIHNYVVGRDGNTSHPQIIGNNQQSSTITLTSSQDTYFPSMVAFTTKLYEPRICYKQEFLDKNGQLIDTLNVGETITIATWISNMKKDAADGNLETADKVEITMELDSTNLAYNNGTFTMQNLGETTTHAKTDISADDTIDWFSETNTSKWRVGTGSTKIDGGQILPNIIGSDSLKAFIRFQTTLRTQGDVDINNIYKVSYENSLLGVRFGDESPLNIGVCQDINTSLGITGLLGVFNVVNEFGGSFGFSDATSPQTSLGTQIVSKPFNIKIISLNSNKDALSNYTGDINISLISTPNYAPSDSDSNKQTKCDDALSLTTPSTRHFSTVDNLLISNFSYDSAIKNASFKLSYVDNGTLKNACSLDQFAIRPKNFEITIPLSTLKSGEDYNYSFIAKNDTNNATNNYNEAVESSFKIDVNETKTGCINGAFTPEFKTGWSFVSGTRNFTSNYSEVGVINVKIEEINGSEFAIIDAGDTNDSTRFISPYNKNLSFLPDHFGVSATLTNQTNGFTYISNDLNMSADLNMTITAQTENNTTTENYNSSCYAQNTDYNISYNNLILSPTDTLSQILYRETNTSITGSSQQF